MLKHKAPPLFVLVVLMSPDFGFAHGGGIDSYGCHNQTSTGTYHCHSGTLSGRTFSSKEAMLLALGGSGNPSPTPSPTASASPSPSPNPTTPGVPVAYDRDLYQHWIDADGDCQDTRQEVLIAESVISPVLSANGCSVVSGLWNDPYTGRSFTNPSDLDIDHLIPLKEAHDSGAWAWSSVLKRAFANDLQNPLTLIAVDDSTNQSKSDRDPALWMPPNTSYHCDYIQSWVSVKKSYGLSVDGAEQAKINSVMGGRDTSPMSRSGAKLGSSGDQPSTATFSTRVTSPGLCGFSSTTTPTQAITLAAEYKPEPAHVGMGADIFVVIELGGNLFMRTQSGEFAAWDFNIANLLSAGRVTSLSTSHTLTIFTGTLGLAGDLSIFLAYRTDAGDFVYSPVPAVLSVR